MLHVPIHIGGYCRTASPRTRKGAMPIVHLSVCLYINCGTRHNIMSFGRGGRRVLYIIYVSILCLCYTHGYRLQICMFRYNLYHLNVLLQM